MALRGDAIVETTLIRHASLAESQKRRANEILKRSGGELGLEACKGGGNIPVS